MCANPPYSLSAMTFGGALVLLPTLLVKQFRSSPLGKPYILCNKIHKTTRVMSPKALLVLAEGAEEMEAVITADVLRRADIDVTLANLESTGSVKCSRNVVIVPDKQWKDVQLDTFDVLILPGGMNAAKTFAKSEDIGNALKSFEQSGKLIAVICASPIALVKHEIGLGKKITSHPSVSKEFSAQYKYCEDRVVKDGQLITSRAPGTAFEFALAIVEHLQSKDKADQILPPMLLK